MTNGHLDWCIREHYLDLLENYRKGKIQTFEFCISFENTGKLTSDILDILESNLIILSPNEKSLVFSDLLEEVFDIYKTPNFVMKTLKLSLRIPLKKFFLKFKSI